MPKSKRDAEGDALAALHAEVSGSSGYRVQRDGSDHSEATARRLKSLESRGVVMFVAGTGWVDSSSAVRRFVETTGLEDYLKKRFPEIG
jgi:hypothetical protein